MLSSTARRRRRQYKSNILNKFAHYFGLKTDLLQGLKIFFCCSCILLFTSSSPCRKDQFAVFWFSSSYYCTDHNWETRHHSTVCRCGLADIFYSFVTSGAYSDLALEKCWHFATPHFVVGWRRKTSAYFLRLTLIGLALKQICGEKKLLKNCAG